MNRLVAVALTLAVVSTGCGSITTTTVRQVDAMAEYDGALYVAGAEHTYRAGQLTTVSPYMLRCRLTGEAGDLDCDPVEAPLTVRQTSTSERSRPFTLSTTGGEPEINILQAAEGCDAGRASSCSELGRAFLDGIGVQQNRAHGCAAVQRACDLGDAAACSVHSDECD